MPARSPFRGLSKSPLLASLLLLLAVIRGAGADPYVSAHLPLLDAEQVQWLTGQEQFRIGLPVNQAPLSALGSRGEAEGLMADYVRLLSRKLATPVELVTGTSRELEEALLAGEIDALAMMSPGTWAERQYRLTQALFRVPYAIFTRQDDASISRLKGLEQKRIALSEDDDFPFALLEPIGQYTPSPVRSLEEAMVQVGAGRADAFLAPLPVGLALMRQGAGNRLQVVAVLADQPRHYALAVLPENERLHAVLNAAVGSISGEEHRVLRSTWLEGYGGKPFAGLSTELTPEEQAWLRTHPNLRMAFRAAWPPLEFQEGGRRQGLVPDLVRALEEELEYTFQPVIQDDIASAENRLETGALDVMAALPRTPKRESRFLFTRSYLTLPIALVTRDQGRFVGDLRELDRERVGAVQGYAAHEFLLINHPDLNLVPVQTLQDGLLQLSNGDLDVMVTHIPGVSYTVGRLGLANLRITSITPYQYELRMAVRPDMPELVSILNKALARIEQPGYEQIYNRWIHLDIDPSIDYTVLRRVIVIALVILAVFLYWNRKLSREVDVRIRSEDALRGSEDALREEKLRAEALAREADAANRAKSEFLANMSHEIRTPMNAVMGYTELLEQYVTDARQRGYLESIKAGSRSLLTLINDILDLSRVEAGKMSLEYRPMDLARLLEDARRIFAARAESRGLELEVGIEGELPPMMVLDETRLRQVLFNLIGNAIKFTDAGSVRVRARVEETVDTRGHSRLVLVIAVRDTGIGIPFDQQARIFEAFEQQQGQSNRQYGGTGLGLAISRKLVDMMGGELLLESAPGRGSCFTVRIGDVEVASTQGDGDEAGLRERHYRFEPARVLVVDDNQTNRHLVRDMLEPEGLAVLEAVNGREALTLAASERPDLILMDIRMPEMDGFATRAAINRDPALSPIPVVALTASVMPSEASRIREARFHGYLRKPVSRHTLLAELARFLVHDELADDAPEQPPAAMPYAELPARQQRRLQARLQREFEPWRRTLADSGDPAALRAFAEALRICGEEEQVQELLDYSDALIDAIDAFELDRVSEVLAEFPPVAVAVESPDQLP